MSDLIINGIDHGKFYIEWAKRGGVLVSLESENTQINVFKFLRSVTAEKIEVSTMSKLCFVTNFYEYRRVFRMATPAECADAGVEYIEPPARWFPIESAPEDGRIIEVADFRVVVANECPLSKHWKFWRDIPHPLNKNSMTQPPKGE
jgi:hypothetical protein